MYLAVLYCSLLYFAISSAQTDCSATSLQPIITAMFNSLGADCALYFSLFTTDAVYYHQHDGFKDDSQLYANCKAYATFCPSGQCQFLQNGRLLTARNAGEGRCGILAPYIWAEIPLNHKVAHNLEPHNGWEFMQVVRENSSTFGWKIDWFAEVETTYSVAFNFGNPLDTSVYNWTVVMLGGTASKGECNSPVNNFIQREIKFYSSPAGRKLLSPLSNISPHYSSSYFQQQGSAVVLSVGGLCHVVVPLASQLVSDDRQHTYIKTALAVLVGEPTGSDYSGIYSNIFWTVD